MFPIPVRLQRTFRPSAAAVLVIVLAAAPASAQTWVGPNGSFQDAANWSTATVPGPFNDAYYTSAGYFLSTFDSDWVVHGLYVPNGQVNLGLNGHTFSATLFNIGNVASQSAPVHVTGGTMLTGGGLQMGFAANGFSGLTLDHTAWASGGAQLAYATGSIANVYIQNGSSFSSSGSSVIGFSGNGSVTVEDAGSSYSTGPNSVIGLNAGGAGTINVLNGGSLRSTGAMTLGSGAPMGTQPASTGTVILANTGSSWTHTDGIISTGGGISYIAVKTGTMLTVTGTSLAAGITLNANATLEADGAVNVSGIGASGITVSGGTMTVNPGGAVTTKNLTLSGAGQINFNGGTLTVNGGAFDSGGAPVLLVSGTGNPVFQLQNAYALNVSGVNVGTLPQMGTASSPGTLNVVSNSAFAANGAITAGNNGSAGNILVDGSFLGFYSVNTNALLLGGTGGGSTGVLTVQNGGTFGALVNTNATSILGQGNYTTGSVFVSGTGSAASLGTLSVGVAGNGFVTASAGGALIATQITVGETGPGRGQVTVTGAGSTLTATYFYLGGTSSGAGGTGSLTVSNGGSATLSRAFLWAGGSMTINGGSIYGSLTTLQAGSSLTINSGGTLTTAIYNSAGTLNLNSGTLTVNGQGGGYFSNSASSADLIIQSNAANALATLQLNSAYTQNIANLSVGDSKPGALVLTNGAQVTATNVTTATSASGNGTITLSGQATSLTSTGYINIGGPPNTGNPAGGSTLTVGPGSIVSVGTSLSVYSGSVVNLNGGTVTVGSLSGGTGGTFNWTSGTFGYNGSWFLDASQLNTLLGVGSPLTANHTILGSSHAADRLTLFDNLTVAGGSLLSANLYNSAALTVSAGTVYASGTLTNNAGALILAQSGALIGGATTNNGEFQLGGGGARLTGALTNNGRLDGSGTVTGNLTNNAGATISVDAGQRLVFAGTTNTNNANAYLNMTGGTLEFTGTLNNAAGGFISGSGNLRGSSANNAGIGFINNGAIAFSGGTNSIFGQVQNLGGATGGQIVVAGGGTLTFNDNVVHNGQEIRTVSGSRSVFFGSVTGAGPFTGTGSVEFDGTLHPGNSPDIVTYSGNIVIGHTATVQVEIGGQSPNPLNTQMLVAGNAGLDGTLSISLINNYQPTIGQQFAIMTFGSRQGSFGTYSGLALGNGLQLTPEFGANSLYLAVTPISAAPGQFTWAGASSGSWNNPNNWSPVVIPASSIDTQLSFGGSANATMTNDISGTLLLNSMIFNSGSPAYRLSGNGLNFQTSSGGMLPQIVSNSANAVTIGAALTLTNNLTVSGTGNLTVNGAIGGAGSLTYSGAGILALTATNSYSGGTTINAGTLAVTSDAALGTGPVTFGTAFATLNYTATTTTARSFTLGSGTMAVAAGQTLTLNGSAVSSGYLDGSGTFATSAAGAQFAGVTTRPSVTLASNSGADRFINFTNSGSLAVAAGLTSPVTFSGFVNQGSGAITVGQDSQVNAVDFQSYGTLRLNPGSFNGTTGGVTQLTNTGASPLYFNGGSRTFLSTAAQAPNTNAGIDLNGKDATVVGGLFVNNGYVIDTSNGGNGTHRVVADFGAVVKGAGFYQTLPRTINGGTFSTGNSPGSGTTGAIVLGGPNDPNGGLSSYTWQINDAGPSATYPAAPGVSGPTANAAGQVSGWGLLSAVIRTVPVHTTGNFNWDATATDQFTIHAQTLLAPNGANGSPSSGGGYETSGDNTLGPMSHFDPTKAYTWLMFSYAGTYTGPTDTASLDAATMFDTTNFLNLPVGARLDWVLNQSAKELDLVYTPTAVPEPGAFALLGVAAIGWVTFWRRRWQATPTAA